MSPRFPDGLVIQQWFKERNPRMMMNASVFTNGRIVASGGWAHMKENDDTPEDVKAHVNELYGKIGLGDREL